MKDAGEFDGVLEDEGATMSAERTNSIFSDRDLLDILESFVALQSAVGVMVPELANPSARARVAAYHHHSTEVVDKLLKRLDKTSNG